MQPTCVRCRTNPATVSEPCCAAPDCDTTIYLVCVPCEREEWDELEDQAAEAAFDRYMYDYEES